MHWSGFRAHDGAGRDLASTRSPPSWSSSPTPRRPWCLVRRWEDRAQPCDGSNCPDGVAAAEVPGLRYVRPDGSLVFPKFAPKDFRQDVHATLYRCVATNSVGSVASRDVKVRAGEFGLLGNKN
ncbi:hypothetical protein MTO96_000885 [Rhipicephalus appendiculatus]